MDTPGRPTDGNTSLASLRFLATFFRPEAPAIRHVWNAFASIMTESNAQVRFRDDSWEQDWFLAKYAAEVPGIGIAAHYVPPADFTSFPTFDVDACVERLARESGVTTARTRAKIRVPALFAEPTSDPVSIVDGVHDFHALRQRIRAHGDPAMRQLNHVIAWLRLALGHLFGGIALTPADSSVEPLRRLCEERWALVWNEEDPYEQYMTVPERIQWKLDVFYGAEIRRVGLAMRPSRQGQPRQWREHWNWLSTDVDPVLALAAVQLAARVVVSIPVCLFLQQLFREARESVTTGHLLATVVLRRWILQLQTMAWLEAALTHSWEHLRPQDLITFAFSALRPHWPRRLFGLSHRSLDVKHTLSTTRAWGSFRYSIDATFVPHWETNVATVWGLFSTTPGLIRVPSEHYADSVWCRRERELFEYLREDDFLDGRHLIEMPLSALASLDAAIPATDAEDQGVPSGRGQFPRMTTVFTLFPFEPWENRLLACAAAVRILFLRLQDPDLTRIACMRLANGTVPPREFAPLTNHPAGWSSVMELFASFHRDWADSADRFPLAVIADGPAPEDLVRDLDSVGDIVDLGDGVIDEVAVLAALEWNRTVLPGLVGDHRYGSFFSIDLRHLTHERWAGDEAFMVIRGVTRVRTVVPLWLLQRDGQRVDEWPGMGTNPVFTSHVEGQWNWMMELLAEPEWPASFQAESGLRFSDKLATACAATRQRGQAYYQGKIR
jgi:hypothetical protein